MSTERPAHDLAIGGQSLGMPIGRVLFYRLCDRVSAGEHAWPERR